MAAAPHRRRRRAEEQAEEQSTASESEAEGGPSERQKRRSWKGYADEELDDRDADESGSETEDGEEEEGADPPAGSSAGSGPDSSAPKKRALGWGSAPGRAPSPEPPKVHIRSAKLPHGCAWGRAPYARPTQLEALMSEADRLANWDGSIVKQYTPFSREVYGEVLSPFVRIIIKELKLTKDDVFLDIGCGWGNVVFQVAALVGCRAVGIEVRADLHQASMSVLPHFNRLMAENGIEAGECEFHCGDASDHSGFEGYSKIFMANLAFPEELSQKILDRFKATLADKTMLLTLRHLDKKYKPHSGFFAGSPLHIFRWPFRHFCTQEGVVSWTAKRMEGFVYVVDRDRRWSSSRPWTETGGELDGRAAGGSKRGTGAEPSEDGILQDLEVGGGGICVPAERAEQAEQVGQAACLSAADLEAQHAQPQPAAASSSSSRDATAAAESDDEDDDDITVEIINELEDEFEFEAEGAAAAGAGVDRGARGDVASTAADGLQLPAAAAPCASAGPLASPGHVQRPQPPPHFGPPATPAPVEAAHGHMHARAHPAAGADVLSLGHEGVWAYLEATLLARRQLPDADVEVLRGLQLDARSLLRCSAADLCRLVRSLTGGPLPRGLRLLFALDWEPAAEAFYDEGLRWYESRGRRGEAASLRDAWARRALPKPELDA